MTGRESKHADVKRFANGFMTLSRGDVAPLPTAAGGYWKAISEEPVRVDGKINPVRERHGNLNSKIQTLPGPQAFRY